MKAWIIPDFFTYLGLFVTALTLAGLFVIPHYFNLWLAVTGGSSLILSGIYIHKYWR